MKKQLIVATALTTLCSLNTMAIDGKDIEIAGYVEVQSTYAKSQGVASSDITLDMVELSTTFNISEKLTADAVFLYEETGEDKLLLDLGYLTYAVNDSFSISAGKKILPFGQMASNMMYEPNTILLGESYDSIVEFVYKKADFSFSAYGFNGNVSNNSNQENQTKDYGFDLNYTKQGENYEVKLGASYLSNIGDTDGLEGSMGSTNTLLSTPAGMSYYMTLNYKDSELIVESMSASDKFDAATLGGKKPQALQVEFTQSFDGMSASVGYQKSKGMQAVTDAYETTNLFQFSKVIDSNSSVKFEYQKSETFTKTGNEIYTLGWVAEF